MLADNFDFLLTEVVEEEDRDLPLQKFKKKHVMCYYIFIKLMCYIFIIFLVHIIFQET